MEKSSSLRRVGIGPALLSVLCVSGVRCMGGDEAGWRIGLAQKYSPDLAPQEMCGIGWRKSCEKVEQRSDTYSVFCKRLLSLARRCLAGIALIPAMTQRLLAVQECNGGRDRAGVPKETLHQDRSEIPKMYFFKVRV